MKKAEYIAIDEMNHVCACGDHIAYVKEKALEDLAITEHMYGWESLGEENFSTPSVYIIRGRRIVAVYYYKKQAWERRNDPCMSYQKSKAIEDFYQRTAEIEKEHEAMKNQKAQETPAQAQEAPKTTTTQQEEKKEAETMKKETTTQEAPKKARKPRKPQEAKPAQEEKPADVKKFIFMAAAIRVNGKEYAARYEVQAMEDYKRGQTYPTVYIYAKVDEKTVKIAVPADDTYYMEAYAAATNAAQVEPSPALRATSPRGEAEQTPAEHSTEEQPAADPAPEAPAAQEAQQTPAEHLTEEQPADDPAPEATSAREEPQQTPAEHSTEEQPAAPEEAAQEAPAPQDEAPAAIDPKAAHGPIPEKDFVGKSLTGTGYRIFFDAAAQRTRVIIPQEYRQKARAEIEKAGFYYSAAMDSWNKKLTFRAYRAAVALAAELDKVLAA